MSFTKTITLRYVFVLSVLAAVAIVSDYILQEKIRAEQNRAAIINVSGRQRMLLQRIALNATLLTYRSSLDAQGAARRELLAAIDLMEKSIQALISGDAAMNLPGSPSPEVRKIYFEEPFLLKEKLQEFLAESRAFSQLDKREALSGNSRLANILAAANSELLHPLNEVVKQYQNESETGISNLQKLERSVMIITVIALLVMALLVFRPMGLNIKNHLLEREDLIAELREALGQVKTLSGLIPICADCKKIRDDKGFWNRLEDYFKKHADADFTHGLCPDCQIKFEEGD